MAGGAFGPTVKLSAGAVTVRPARSVIVTVSVVVPVAAEVLTTTGAPPCGEKEPALPPRTVALPPAATAKSTCSTPPLCCAFAVTFATIVCPCTTGEPAAGDVASIVNVGTSFGPATTAVVSAVKALGAMDVSSMRTSARGPAVAESKAMTPSADDSGVARLS